MAVPLRVLLKAAASGGHCALQVKMMWINHLNQYPVCLSFADQQPCPVCVFYTCSRVLWKCDPQAGDKTSSLVKYGNNASTSRNTREHQGRNQATGWQLLECFSVYFCPGFYTFSSKFSQVCNILFNFITIILSVETTEKSLMISVPFSCVESYYSLVMLMVVPSVECFAVQVNTFVVGGRSGEHIREGGFFNAALQLALDPCWVCVNTCSWTCQGLKNRTPSPSLQSQKDLPFQSALVQDIKDNFFGNLSRSSFWTVYTETCRQG